MPQFVDADTIGAGTTKIRLSGIDAPESDQRCLDSHGQLWSCGLQATSSLQAYSGNRPWTCQLSGFDRYGRRLGTCSVQGEDIGRWLVRNGWALAYRRYSTAYVEDEDYAREHQLGLWGGAFIAPWDWRHRDRRTVVLGALTVPITAQAELLAPASAAQAPSPSCTNKGNVNRRGERIYHMPASVDYAMVNMAAPEKRWFCTEDEAKAAGWRPARR